jgi:hypothetical protein
MFRPTCRTSSGVTVKIKTKDQLLIIPSPDIYGIYVLTAKAVEIMSKEV